LSHGKKILVSPLDWGLGHATRCIPVIRALIDNGMDVVLGSGGSQTALLGEEFPGLEQVPIPGYGIRYSRGAGMLPALLRQLPRLMRAVRREHKLVDQLVKEGRIDAVISDNRFGLWSARVPSVYISHQLNIKAPKGFSFAESFLHRLHAGFIRNFDQVWIPDQPDAPGFSGDLAHRRKSPVAAHFIGPLTRFSRPLEMPEKKYDLMFIISGPEPQREIFHKMAMHALKNEKYKAVVVSGTPGSERSGEHSDNIEIYPHLSSPEMQEAMLSSGLIICRPGYSTIMDLATLGCRAAFVPTPGQTEQEYLARLHSDNGHYFHLRQKDFDLDTLVRESEYYSGMSFQAEPGLLERRIVHLLSDLKDKQ